MTSINQDLRHLRSSASYYLDPMTHPPSIGFSQAQMNMTPASRFARVAGCFMLFIPEQQETSTRIFEDGFAMLLATDVWVKLREAMFTGQSITVPASEKQFRLEHTEVC